MKYLIQTLPKRGNWVFSSEDGAQPIYKPNRRLTEICKVAGIEHLTIHGLRRSFGSLAEWLELPAGVVAQIQGHKPPSQAPAPKTEPQKPKSVIEKMKEAKAEKEANTFIESPIGGLDYGEITPDMAKAMRRQAGKIRLRQGNEAWGLTHIERRHNKDFKALGFDGAKDFVSQIASGFTKIYKGRGAALDVVLDDKSRGMLIVSLEPSTDGDFYDIKTATPIRRDQFKNEEPLWVRNGPIAPATKDSNSPPFPESRSGSASVAQAEQEGKPKSKPNQEAKPSNGAASGVVEGETQAANQEKPAPKKEKPLTVGTMPNTAEAVTVKDGVVFIGKHEALDYDSGEPITVPKGSSREDVAKALKDAGAIVGKMRIFGLGEQAGDVMFSRQQSTLQERKKSLTGFRGNASPVSDAAIDALVARLNGREAAVVEHGNAQAAVARPSVVIARTWADMPAAVREHAAQSGYDNTNKADRILGAQWHGKMYLVQENISSVQEAEETLLHERVHQALRGNANDKGGVELRKALNLLYIRVGGGSGIAQLASQAGVDLKDIRKQGAHTDSNNRNALVMEEFLATLDGNRAYEQFSDKVKRALQEFVGSFRNWLRNSGLEGLANRLGANLDAATLSDVRSMLKGLREQKAGTGSDAVRFLRVWHGTPHRGIEQTGFKLNKIGTGEGAQVYGHGIYFAQVKDVADTYRKKLTTAEEYVDGQPYNGDDARHFLAKILSEESGNAAEARDVLESLSLPGGSPSVRQAAKNALSLLETGERPIFETIKPDGQLYGVDIPENHELLDWDKPLSEQPEQVRKALERESYSDDMTGKEVYERLSSEDFNGRHGAKVASEYLKSIGIPGLRYLDGNSRGDWQLSPPEHTVSGKWMVKDRNKPESKGLFFDNEADARIELAKQQAGTHNFVIWDESRLTPEAAKIEPMYSRSANTKAAYEARIDALFKGEKATTGTRVLDRSDVMGLLGHANVPLVLNESHLRDGMTSHPEMTAAIWKKVPEWIDNPAIAFKSENKASQNRVVLLAPETVAGYPIRLVIDYMPERAGAKNTGEAKEHLLVTVFAKTNEPHLPSVGRLAADGSLLYVDNKIAPELWQRRGVQFPKYAATQGRGKILTEKNLAGWRKANSAQSTDNTQRESTAVTLASAPSTLAKVQSAIEGMFEGIDDVRQRIAKGTTVVNDASELPEHLRQGAEDARAQGVYDPYGDRVYLIASRIEAGQEKAVWLHEVFHKRGKELLGEALPRLHQAVQRWASRPANSVERQIYEAAHERATNDGNYEAEFLAYAIEEAVNRGVKPDLKGNITGAAYWLGKVREAFAAVVAKLTGMKPAANAISAEELVATTYAAAGLEVAGRQGVADATALRDLVRLAKASGNENKTLNLGAVAADTLNLLRSEGVAVEDGFTHSLDMFAVRHALNRHSDANVEASRGQIAITETDVAQIAQAIQEPTAYVLGGKTPRGQDIVGSIKRLTDGSLLYLEEVRSGRKTLAMTSMRKYPSTTDFDTIAKSVLPSNARSDAGDVRIVDAQTQQGKPLNSQNTTGHAQPLDEPVLTPSGWRSIGDMQVGDEIYAYDGTITYITGVYPQGEQDVLRVELDDGRHTRATTDHLWQLAIDEGGAVTIATTNGLRVGDALPVV